MKNASYREAYLALFDNPDELRLGAGPSSFIGIRDGAISISGGVPSKISVQGLGFTFAGMLEDNKFPFTLIPSTIGSPNPAQRIKPPFVDIIPVIQQYAILASLIAARV